ncbi:MAG: efflux RND transporter permease subunit [Acidobacteriota bacterium]
MSGLVRWALARPVALSACVLLILGLAGQALVRLPVALLPTLQYPSLLVYTGIPSGSPQTVEQQVTEVIENVIAGLGGLRGLHSRSQVNGSLVRADFGWGVDLAATRLEMREHLDRVRGYLPPDAARPIILHLDPSERPALVIALRASQALEPTHGEMAREIVARRLEQLPGVARVQISGAPSRVLEIEADPEKLVNHGLGVEDLRGVLADAAVESSGGLLRHGHLRLAVEVRSQLDELRRVGTLPLINAKGTVLQLSDVAVVRETTAPRRGLVRTDGRESLLLLVEKGQQANLLETATQVRAALRQLDVELPQVRLEVLVDESDFVRASIDGVLQTIALGGVLALAVLLVFLRRPRALVALAVSIPLSLLVTVVLFDVLGLTLNLISLGGLALGIGLLVDNSIVVAENIARRRQEGDQDAALHGAIEVAPAITVSTLTTLAVFVPLTFSDGLAGRLFRDQSLAVACSLLASLAVALTVVPALSRGKGWGVAASQPGRLGSWLGARYRHGLDWILVHPYRTLAAALALLIVMGVAASGLPREVIPKVDRSLLAIRLAFAPGTALETIDQAASRLEERLLATPGVERLVADLGERDEARMEIEPRPAHAADVTVLLARDADTIATARRIREHLDDLSLEGWVELGSSRLEDLLVQERHDLVVEIMGQNPGWEGDEARRLVTAIEAEPLFDHARLMDAERIPGFRLRFLTEVMMRHGVDAATLGEHLRAAADARGATALRAADGRLPVTVTLRDTASLGELLARPVMTKSGPRPLGLFVEADTTSLRAVRFREDRIPVRRLEVMRADSGDLASAAASLGTLVDSHLQPPLQGRVTGASEKFRELGGAVGTSLLLSLGIVYFLLAAHFESFIVPWVVLSTVPLALVGVVPALMLTGETVNLMSLVGCVVLVGIVVNDAIVKIDLIRQRQHEQPLVEAIVSASHDRVRPILMTTVTTVLGLLPMAIHLGEGAELRAPLAVTLVGGMAGATLLTLFVVPALYLVAERARLRIGRLVDAFSSSDRRLSLIR